MSKDKQLEKYIKAFVEANDASTQKAIEKYVNGGIRKLETKLDEHVVTAQKQWDAQNAFMTEMLPLRDGTRIIQAIVKFLKWTGIPITVLLAWVLAKFNINN